MNNMLLFPADKTRKARLNCEKGVLRHSAVTQKGHQDEPIAFM